MASPSIERSSRAPAVAAYLDLLKSAVLGELQGSPPRAIVPPLSRAGRMAHRLARRAGIELLRPRAIDSKLLEAGVGWPEHGETMIGRRRLHDLEACCVDVIDRGVPGDFIEAGVWRGGAAILMRGVLRAYGISDRRVWAADSFAGLPRPDPARYPPDAKDELHTFDALSVSEEEVRANFQRYGLLDAQVRLLKGWFRDTLPTTSEERWAVARLDGDMYESTIDALHHLYPNLSVGGWLIVDDYGNPYTPGARRATDDYRAAHGIEESIERIDWTAVRWRRTA